MLQSWCSNNTGVSACLIGEKCRYDGNSSKEIKELMNCVSFCPEVLGGLPTPRIPCQIENGDGNDVLSGKSRIIGSDGKDYTKEFLNGANEALKICLEKNIDTVILKEKSPSCGTSFVYNNNTLVAGCGVTAALLKQNGITVISDTEVDYE